MAGSFVWRVSTKDSTTTSHGSCSCRAARWLARSGSSCLAVAGNPCPVSALKTARSKIAARHRGLTHGDVISPPASISELAQALGSACPGLNLSGVRLVDTGFGSIVLETGDGLILRVARTAAVARGHAIEAVTLPHLARSLPVAIPVPCLLCPPTRELPFGAIGYAKMEGQPCQPGTATAATGRDLGNFLAVLHQLDIRAFPAMPGQHAVWGAWSRLRDDTAAILRDRLTSGENQRMSQWWERFLSDRALREYRPAVRHGDLWYGNLLIRPDGSITAVLDWEAVAIADPAQDLALTRYLGAGFTASVLDAYRRHDGAYDEQVEYRIEWHWQLRELTGLPLAAATGDQDEIAECIAKLRAGPIFSPVQ